MCLNITFSLLNSPGVQNMVASCTQDSKPLSVGNCSISSLSFHCLKAVLMFNLSLALEMSWILPSLIFWRGFCIFENMHVKQKR